MLAKRDRMSRQALIRACFYKKGLFFLPEIHIVNIMEYWCDCVLKW